MKKPITGFNKKEIIDLIASGDLDAAIKETRNLARQKDRKAHKTAILLSCRYNILWRENLDGLSSSDEKEILINKIASSLYDIIDNLPDA